MGGLSGCWRLTGLSTVNRAGSSSRRATSSHSIHTARRGARGSSGPTPPTPDGGGNVKIINNSEMKNILNRSDNNSWSVSDISIPYETDLEKLEAQLPALLEEIFRARGDVMLDVPQYLGVQTLDASGIVLRFWVKVAEKNIYAGARALNRELLLGFRRLGVECPFPQMDVHMK